MESSSLSRGCSGMLFPALPASVLLYFWSRREGSTTEVKSSARGALGAAKLLLSSLAVPPILAAWQEASAGLFLAKSPGAAAKVGMWWAGLGWAGLAQLALEE